MDGSAGESQHPATGGQTGGNQLPWHLIPPFKPGNTDINDYTRRLEFLANIWPVEHLAQLAPRACLLCEGTAFQKVVRLDPTKLKVQTIDGIKLVVQTLGGVWGQSKLETKYERFERALYGTVQKSDETHSSYLARHEIQFEELVNMGTTLEEMRAYVLVRNSGLLAEDKKKIIIDAQGNLEYKKVVDSLQLLGSKFFAEVQSGGTRTKTYDVFHVDDGDREDEEMDETAFVSLDQSEDAGLETLLSEGDEDALIISQFEEALVDSLQNDPEVATCLNSYVEARKRVTEKVKARGFFGNKGSKGKSKGKFKGGFKNRFRKPLAQRILESTCRLCNQPGHWKAECPQRTKSNVPGTNNTAFAGMTVFSTMAQPPPYDHAPEDVDAPPPEATAFMMEETCLMTAAYHEKGPQHDHRTYHVHELNRVLSKCKPAFLARLPYMCRSRQESEKSVSTCDPLSKNHELATVRVQLSEESINFVSQGTYGIVDLGASMSVIGQSQFTDLCQMLPKSVLQSMKEAPCAINFRFGNDSSVMGKRSVFFPVGDRWIKVVIVPSNTPFLIANSVFRSLGAVIDTGLNQIFFKALGRTVPIEITDRKLYRLDLLDLLQTRDPAKREQTLYAASSDKSSSVEVDEVSRSIDVSQPIESEDPICTVHPAEHPCLMKPAAQQQDRLSPACQQPVDCHSVVSHVPESCKSPVRPVGRSSPPSVSVGKGFRESPTDHVHDTCRARERDHQVWQSSLREDLCVHGDRAPLHDVVRGDLHGQPPDGTRQVPPIHSAACRKSGEEQSGDQCHHSAEGQSLPQGSSQHDAHRPGVGTRRVGSSARGEHSGTPTHAAPYARDRECDAAGSCSSEGASRRTTVIQSEPDETLMPVQPLLLTDLCGTWQQLSNDNPLDPVIDQHDVGENIFYSRTTNWIAKEMRQYFASKGVLPESPLLKTHRADVFEIYCSPESQLTQQARAQGLWAERHSLQDGDLKSQPGRFRLYERLLRLRPKHVWLSPKCKAWCRWNEFNRHKTPELARRIMLDREEDQVHLMLCDAVFEFQRHRNPHYDAHLEQPVGSQMLFQEELETIMANTWHARCDMCTAGNLKHPMTGNHLQKGTQIVTTSQIMHRYVDSLRCDKTHDHDHVEGSFRNTSGDRVNISQYTELYTRTFAMKIARCIRCSIRVQERSAEEFSLTIRDAEKPAEVTDSKRRKLSHKQPPTEGYLNQEVWNQRVDQFLKVAIDHAPRVGKRFLSNGTYSDEPRPCFQNVGFNGLSYARVQTDTEALPQM